MATTEEAPITHRHLHLSWPATILLAFLAATGPFARFMFNNRTETSDYGSALGAGLIVASSIVVAAAVMKLFKQRFQRGIYALAVAVPLVFNFPGFLRFLGAMGVERLELGLWLLGSVALVVLGWLLERFRAWRSFVWIFFSLQLTFPVVGIVHWRFSTGTSDLQQERALAARKDGGAQPNIYYLLLDGYPRADQLRSVLGYKGISFDDALEKRGFVVPAASYSNYPVTFLSVASTFEMDYIATRPSDLARGEERFYQIGRGRNRFVHHLRAAGYRFVHAGDWYLECGSALADDCIRPRRTGLHLSYLQRGFVEMTGVLPLLKRAGLAKILGVATLLPTRVVDDFLALEVRDPVFLFAHVLSPHNGERFERDCSIRVLTDLFAPHVRGDESSRSRIVEEVECITTDSIDALDRLLSKDPDAIYVVQSDHGTYFGVDMKLEPSDWPIEWLEERFGSFTAVRSPCGYPSVGIQSNVNTLRRVLRCVGLDGGQDLPNRFFFNDYEERLEEILRVDWPPALPVAQ